MWSRLARFSVLAARTLLRSPSPMPPFNVVGPVRAGDHYYVSASGAIRSPRSGSSCANGRRPLRLLLLLMIDEIDAMIDDSLVSVLRQLRSSTGKPGRSLFCRRSCLGGERRGEDRAGVRTGKRLGGSAGDLARRTGPQGNPEHTPIPSPGSRFVKGPTPPRRPPC